MERDCERLAGYGTGTCITHSETRVAEPELLCLVVMLEKLCMQKSTLWQETLAGGAKGGGGGGRGR